MKKVSCIVFLLLVLPRLGYSEAEGPAKADSWSAEEMSKATAVLRSSMKEKNGVTLERLVQTDLQRACSNPLDRPLSDQQAAALRGEATSSVIYPAVDNYLGDWREGEKIAQNGKGMQYSDDPDTPNGGNCYACHQLDPTVIAAGNIGPPLTNYGQRGQSELILKYTWAKMWNPNATMVCSHMPRFGDAGILTPDQIRHLMALLLDPDSPVNR